MSSQQGAVQVEPSQTKPRPAPRWHVVLLDDDDHTYAYVIEMLNRIFGYSQTRAYAMACEVDQTGRVIVATEVFERAEFHQQQIHAFGADRRIPRCQGAMRAVLEPADDA
jgi:ATP-dependent Clp protease adaptor protein ClpS